MSQADNYTPQEVIGTTAELEVVIPWIFDGIDELEISQTDGATVVTLGNNDFDAFVTGQRVTVENFYGVGNLTTITVVRDTKQTQEYTLSETNDLDSKALEETLNKTVRMIQDISFKTDILTDSFTGGDLADLLLNAITSLDSFIIPPKDNRKNVWFGFDTNGNPFYGVPTGVTPPVGPINPEDFLTIINDIKIVTGTSYTLLDSDTGKFIIFTNAADVTVTSPADLTDGHQVMYLKTAADNEISHVEGIGAEHVNLIPVVASKQYAWYSHVIFENIGGIAAKYRFIGEIDETDINNIEVVSRTLLIESTFTGEDAQALIDSAGKYLNQGVELKILFEDMTMIITQAIVIAGFTGPGLLTVGTLTEPASDTVTARPVTITNSNNPPVGDYKDYEDFDNTSVWDAFLANSVMLISGNTCSQLTVYGFSMSAKVFPIVLVSNSAMTFVRRNFFNQINGFDTSEYEPTASLKWYGGTGLIDSNKFTTDSDSAGVFFIGCQIQLRDSAGNGNYLVRGGGGVTVADDSGNSDFTWTTNKYKIKGFWVDGTIEA